MGQHQWHAHIEAVPRDLRLHDPDGAYIRRWVREVDEDDYPETIVEHKAERADALRRYSKIT